jgi:hypothetical protein
MRRLGPPRRINKRRSRQRETQEIFDLPERENHRIRVPFEEVFVEESKRSSGNHAALRWRPRPRMR